MTSVQKNVEQASESYSSSFDQGNLPLPPAKGYLIVTCMDARIDPAQAHSISLGDAHVIRNVSGLVNAQKPPPYFSSYFLLAGC